MNKDVMRVISVVYRDSIEVKIHPYRQIEAYYNNEGLADRALKEIPETFEIRKFSNPKNNTWKLDIWVPNWQEHYY